MRMVLIVHSELREKAPSPHNPTKRQAGKRCEIFLKHALPSIIKVRLEGVSSVKCKAFMRFHIKRQLKRLNAESMPVRVVVTGQKRARIRGRTADRGLEVHRRENDTSERDTLAREKVHRVASRARRMNGGTKGKNRESEESGTCFIHDGVR